MCPELEAMPLLLADLRAPYNSCPPQSTNEFEWLLPTVGRLYSKHSRFANCVQKALSSSIACQ